MDELFNIIGKLYVDIYNMQKYVEVIQNKLKDQEQKINHLRNTEETDTKPLDG